MLAPRPAFLIGFFFAPGRAKRAVNTGLMEHGKSGRMGRNIAAILFDLDDTLMIEMASEQAAFRAAGQFARSRCDLDPDALSRAVFRHAETLWHASGEHDYCRNIGFAPWEGLWSTFESDRPEMQRLRAWAASYRHAVWTRALAELGIEDETLADELAERYRQERAARHELFPDALPAIESLRGDFRLAILTNGAVDVQNRKLAGVGLAPHFETVVITGELGVGKPDPRPFDVTLERLGVSADRAAMVGNSLYSDVRGALNAGLLAVWLEREGAWRDPEDSNTISPDITIHTLAELRDVLLR